MTITELIEDLQAIAAKVPPDTKVYCSGDDETNPSSVVDVCWEDDDDGNPFITIETA